MLRELNLVPQDACKSCVPILPFERGRPVEHLVDEYTKGPPVNGAGMSAALDNLRRDILLGPDKGVRPEISDARLGVNGRQGGR